MDMTHSEEYEQYLEQELLLCQRRHAFCQEISGLTNSEMVDLEHREQKLMTALQRLREARELFSKDQLRLPRSILHEQIRIRKGEV
jgi:hypothetical protein